MKIVVDEEVKTEAEIKTEKNAQKYFKLMAEFKAQLKTLSHNELARQYVALYSQHVLLQKLHDDLKAATAADLEAQANKNNESENQ